VCEDGFVQIHKVGIIEACTFNVKEEVSRVYICTEIEFDRGECDCVLCLCIHEASMLNVEEVASQLHLRPLRGAV
jgi:hypothetical protein